MRHGLLALVLAVVAGGLALAADPVRAAQEAVIAPAELRRIELLVQAIEQSTGMHFIRNGVAYDAKTAANFLRLKWSQGRDRVHTAADFVREIGSKSGTTGIRYRVKNADGSEEDSAAFLGRLLAAQARVPSK